MFKRIWILLALALSFVLALSACGGGELAEDLTPIPTLPPGEVPALVAPVESSAPVASTGTEMSDEELVALGEETFAANCSFCHGATDGTGPAFPGMAARAAEQVDGLTAEEYVHESIVDPSAYVVDGFSAMPPVAGQLIETEINGLVAYILAKSVDEGMTAAAPEPTEEPTAAPEPTEEPTTAPEPTEEPTAEPAESTGATVDLELGQTLFEGNCAACHGDADGAGPAFNGMAARAAERVDGLTAEEYIHESIVDPSANVVDGFSDIMPKAYGDQFTADEIASIVGYILDETSDDMATSGAESDTESSDAESATMAAGDPEAGEQIFAANCVACHGEADGAGPARVGMGERAAERVDGLTAEEYIHESIVDPSAYVVDGFGDIMPKAYGEQLSEDDIANLIAYLLTQ